MKRDLDLIRELLLRLEAFPLPAQSVWSIEFTDPTFATERWTLDEVVYHLNLIREAGYTEPYNNQGMSSFTYSGLTWEGHNFLDSVRDPTIWRDTKTVLGKVGGFTAELAIAAAKAILKENLSKIGLNIDL